MSPGSFRRARRWRGRLPGGCGDLLGNRSPLASGPDHPAAGRGGGGEKLVNERGRQLRPLLGLFFRRGSGLTLPVQPLGLFGKYEPAARNILNASLMLRLVVCATRCWASIPRRQ